MNLFEKKYPGHETVIPVGKSAVGGDFVIFAGPCAVESTRQLMQLTSEIKPWVDGFRAGFFKPRTSPYSYAGSGSQGLEELDSLNLGLPLIVELMSVEQVKKWADRIDIVQIGARNMYNYPLLEAAAASGKPVLLKRHFSATIEELLMAAEHILSRGNSQVMLCERGIRAFEPRLRNCLDLGTVCLLKQLTHLPVLVDPSHATGDASLVQPLALASAAAGADGLLLEVHPNPMEALSDGPQSLTPAQLGELTGKLRELLKLVRK